LEDHVGADHAFRVYTSKKKAASNSFLKCEISVMQALFKAAVTGQPVTRFVVRSEGFSGAMNKVTNMASAIALAEKLDKIGEEQHEQHKTVA
jgi:hypothetical protein